MICSPKIVTLTVQLLFCTTIVILCLRRTDQSLSLGRIHVQGDYIDENKDESRSNKSLFGINSNRKMSSQKSDDGIQQPLALSTIVAKDSDSHTGAAAQLSSNLIFASTNKIQIAAKAMIQRVTFPFRFIYYFIVNSVTNLFGSKSASILENYETSLKSWAGKKVTNKEKDALFQIRKLSVENKFLGSSWLENANDVELLRFIRYKHGNVQNSWKSIKSHCEWRKSKYGADSDYIKHKYKDSNLHHKLFWLGNNKQGCPTLVIRSQVHDGEYYDEDPKIFAG